MKWNKSANARLIKYLNSHNLSRGIGNEKSACSIAAMNLALTGELTDNIPECMSAVIGKWIIRVQDAMPDKLRNSENWKSLLPLAAGTGRRREVKRLNLIKKWMWETVLPQLTPTVKNYDFFSKWENMLNERSPESINIVMRASLRKGCDELAPESVRHDAHNIHNVSRYCLECYDTSKSIVQRAASSGLLVYEVSESIRKNRKNYWNKIDCCEQLNKLINI